MPDRARSSSKDQRGEARTPTGPVGLSQALGLAIPGNLNSALTPSSSRSEVSDFGSGRTPLQIAEDL